VVSGVETAVESHGMTALKQLSQHFRARGFFVNSVGRDEEAIRVCIRNQEKEDQRLDQLNLWR